MVATVAAQLALPLSFWQFSWITKVAAVKVRVQIGFGGKDILSLNMLLFLRTVNISFFQQGESSNGRQHWLSVTVVVLIISCFPVWLNLCEMNWLQTHTVVLTCDLLLFGNTIVSVADLPQHKHKVEVNFGMFWLEKFFFLLHCVVENNQEDESGKDLLANVAWRSRLPFKPSSSRRTVSSS